MMTDAPYRQHDAREPDWTRAFIWFVAIVADLVLWGIIIKIGHQMLS